VTDLNAGYLHKTVVTLFSSPSGEDEVPAGTKGKVITLDSTDCIVVVFDGYRGDFVGKAKGADGGYGLTTTCVRLLSPLEQLAECADEDS